METPKEKEMKMGENIVFIEDYMVWGSNVNGMTGMFSRYETSGRCLIHVPQLGEWCEAPHSSFISKSKGRVPKKNKVFCSRIKTMTVSY